METPQIGNLKLVICNFNWLLGTSKQVAKNSVNQDETCSSAASLCRPYGAVSLFFFFPSAYALG